MENKDIKIIMATNYNTARIMASAANDFYNK